ncbi:MAG: dihydrolipoamide acetyltransferase family protein [Thermaerobacter sp.]|nr:dihydrolipoamide acetyltransferase family protein [Thermaerobacter sp.]
MKHAVLMPSLGETMDEGSIVSWHKSVGDSVAKGEVLFEVMTDKATFEVEAARQGYLRSLVARVDDIVPVGKTVAWLTDTADEPFEEAENADDQAKDQQTSTAPGVIPPHSNGSSLTSGTAVRVSPRARRLLEQHGIAVEAVAAVVPGKPIEASDIEAYLKTQTVDEDSLPVAVDSGRLVPLAGMRATIARRMAQTLEVPQVTLHAHSVVDRMLELHRRVKERPGHSAISLTDWIVKAVSITLGGHPKMNAWFETGGIRQFSHVNVGLAVDTPAGLMVPVIRHADGLTLVEIAEQRVHLRDRALAGRLQPKDFGDGTFTVSNLGGYGVETFTPLLNLPEVGLLGVGRVTTTVVSDGTQFYSEQRIALSLTFDHRAVDGGPAAQFLNEVSHLLMDPSESWV